VTVRALALVAAAAACGHHTGSSGDANGGGGDGAAKTDASDGSTYAAYAITGNLERLRVAKTLASGSTCFAFDLVQNGTVNGGLVLPSGWGFEVATAMQPGIACNPAYLGPIANSYQASTQSGSISWQGSAVPTSVDVDATMHFSNPPTWCPTSAGLLASNVPVH
jgi:hypothetical protein